MAASVSTLTGVGMVATITNPGTITMPLVSQTPNRQLTFKDGYGNLSNLNLTFQTQSPDTFENGQTTRVLNNSFGFVTFYGTNGVWYEIGGTNQQQTTISSLTVSSINSAQFGTGGGITALNLVSTTGGLEVEFATAGFLSSPSLISTTGGLQREFNTAGFLSSPSLISTTGGLDAKFATADFISSLNLLSTVEGLGSSGYISTGGQGYFSSVVINMLPQDAPYWDARTYPALGFDPAPEPLALDIFGSARIIKNLYIGSTTTVIGTAGVATPFVSSASVYTSSVLFYNPQTNQVVPLYASASNLVINGNDVITVQSGSNLGFLSTPNLVSTTGGLQREFLTAGYLSTLSLISTTTGLQTNLVSTTEGLVEVPELTSTVGGVTRGYLTSDYLSTLSLISTTMGLQGNLVSTTGGLVEVPELTSTVGGITRGYLTAGYLSTPSLVSTTSGITALTTSSITNLFIPFSNTNTSNYFQLQASTTELFFGTYGSTAQIYFGDIYSKLGDNSNTSPFLLVEQAKVVETTVDTTPITFSYTGANQTYTVPQGVLELQVTLQGAGGGYTFFAPGDYAAGTGGLVSGRLAVTPGQSLTIIVGQGGTRGGGATYGGGGGVSDNIAGTGGGRSAIRNGGTELVTAGGGGGASYVGFAGATVGGNGGGLTGQSGSSSTPGTFPATGGTQSAGGAAGQFGTNGSQFTGGSGTNSGYGGGGGGWYGGGGGSGTGGGSSYVANLTGTVVNTQGAGAGIEQNGSVIIEPIPIPFSGVPIRKGNILEIRNYSGNKNIVDPFLNLGINVSSINSSFALDVNGAGRFSTLSTMAFVTSSIAIGINGTASYPIEVGGIVQARYSSGTPGYFYAGDITETIAFSTREMMLVGGRLAGGVGISTGVYMQKGANANYTGLHFYTTRNLDTIQTLVLDATTANVGIQCNAPGQTLDVNGTTRSITLSSLNGFFSSINTINPSSWVTAGNLVSTTGGLVEVPELNSTVRGLSNVAVTQIVAGTNVTISPTNGLGAVTINATSGGGSGAVPFISAFTVSTGTVQAVTLSSLQVFASSMGIGTSTPTGQLEVTGMSSLIRISDYTASRNPALEFVRGNRQFGSDIYTDWRIANQLGNLTFYRKDTFIPSDGNAMVLTDLGRVGIGCNNPAFPLDVNGAIQIRSTGTNVTSLLSLQAGYGTNTTGNISRISFSTTGGGGGQVAHTIEQVFEGGNYGMSIKGDNVTVLRLQGGQVGSSNSNLAVGVLCNAPQYALDVNGPAQISSIYFSTTVGGKRIILQQTPFQTANPVPTNCLGVLAENYDSLGNFDTDWLKVRGIRLGNFGASSFMKFERWGSNGFVMASQTAGNATSYDYILASNAFMEIKNVGSLSSFLVQASSLTATNATMSSLQVNGLTIGTGTGWVNIGPLQTVAVSSIQANANTSFAITASSFQGNFSSILSLNAALSSIQTSTIAFGPAPGWVRTNLLQGIVFSSIQTNTSVAYTSSILVGTPSTNAFQIPFFNLQLIQDRAAKPFTTTWTIGSDLRIKENITDANLDRCYEDIRSIHLRRFMWRQDYFNEVQGVDRHVLGFIAQEVSTIVPKAVQTISAYGYPDFQFLNIDQLNMSLYGAVKRTIQDKEILESTVKGQKFQIETLLGIQTMILSTLNGLQGR